MYERVYTVYNVFEECVAPPLALSRPPTPTHPHSPPPHTQTTPQTQDPAPTAFVPNARYDMMATAFGGLGMHVATPEELGAALDKVGVCAFV